MTSLYLDLGSDFVLNQTGGITLSDGWDEIRQRIERRIFTNPQERLFDGVPVQPEYLFHPDYGIGAPAQIGDLYNQNYINTLEQKLNQGVLEDQGVNTSVLPVIRYTNPNPNTLQFQIQVTLANGTQNTITASLP